jgi:hypothetical protein
MSLGGVLNPRERLVAIRRAFNYGKRSTPPQVYSVPYIQMFKENNARQGFVEQDEFTRMAAEAHLNGLWIPESVIMAMGGWKTPSMFLRDAIVSSADQRTAVETIA